jgi:hypothetical protein
MNKCVGFFSSFKKIGDLCVFHPDLTAQKIILALQLRDIAIIFPANTSVRSRLFVAALLVFALVFYSANGRVCSRLVAIGRDCSYLIYVGYMTLD